MDEPIVQFTRQDEHGEMVVDHVLAIGQSPVLSISASFVDDTVAILTEAGLYLVPLGVVLNDQQLVVVHGIYDVG